MYDRCPQSVHHPRTLANEATEISLKRNTERKPHSRCIRLEKQFLPETAVEVAKLYRQLFEIMSREDESPASTFQLLVIAKIIEIAQDSEINPDILLGAFALNLTSTRRKDMVNIVYRTQGQKPLIFQEVMTLSIA